MLNDWRYSQYLSKIDESTSRKLLGLIAYALFKLIILSRRTQKHRNILTIQLNTTKPCNIRRKLITNFLSQRDFRDFLSYQISLPHLTQYFRFQGHFYFINKKDKYCWVQLESIPLNVGVETKKWFIWRQFRTVGVFPPDSQQTKSLLLKNTWLKSNLYIQVSVWLFRHYRKMQVRKWFLTKVQDDWGKKRPYWWGCLKVHMNFKVYMNIWILMFICLKV